MTIIFGLAAILFPVLMGYCVWKYFDRFFSSNDPVYENSLGYFLKKVAATLVVGFIFLYGCISLVFTLTNQASQ